MKKQMKQSMDTVKANPIKAIIISLLLSGSGGGYASYDLVMDFLNMPREIKVLRWRQDQLFKLYIQNNQIDQSELFRIFFTPVDSMNATIGGNL